MIISPSPFKRLKDVHDSDLVASVNAYLQSTNKLDFGFISEKSKTENLPVFMKAEQPKTNFGKLKMQKFSLYQKTS